MPKSQKRVPEMIVDVLRSGKEMELSEIAESVSKMSDAEVKFSNIANHMTRLFHKTEIGNFIIRKRPRDRYVYALAKGALGLNPQQIYDLVCGVGKNKPALQKALRAKPSLKRYLKGQENMMKAEAPGAKMKEPAKKKMHAAEVLTPEKKNGSDSNGLNINLHVTVRFQPASRESASLQG